ncbi:MAG: hypothetical protein ACE5OR_04980, partial [bacterium]
MNLSCSLLVVSAAIHIAHNSAFEGQNQAGEIDSHSAGFCLVSRDTYLINTILLVALKSPACIW